MPSPHLVPPLHRELIEALNYERETLALINEGLSPAATAQRLKEDPIFMDRMEKAGYSNIYPTDIHRFMASRLRAFTAISEGAGNIQDNAALTIAAAKERILSMLALGSDWENLARRCLTILEGDFDRYELEKEKAIQYNEALTDPEAKKRPIPEPPIELINTTRKNILASIQIIQALRGDQQLQGIIRTQTLNIQTGLSQDDFHDIVLEDLAAVLGLTKMEAMTALTKALVRRKARKKTGRVVVDADIAEEDGDGDVEESPPDGGKYASKIPFAAAVENSMNLFKETPKDSEWPAPAST